MSDNANMSYSEDQNTAKLKELVKLPENEQYLFLLKSVPNDAERIRIGLILDYYIKNANKNRKCHRLFSSLGVIIPALATFVSVFSDAENFLCHKILFRAITEFLILFVLSH